MTDWIQLHTDVHITGSDGFSFVLLREPPHNWNIDELSEEEKDFVETCLPGRKPRIINGVEVKLHPYDALRMYLCATMSSTFALSTVVVDYKSHFIIGCRSKKDLFKLSLKWPDTINTKMWDATTKFYVRVAEGDDFSDKGAIAKRMHLRYADGVANDAQRD